MRELAKGAPAAVMIFLARNTDPVTGEDDHATGLTGAALTVSLSKGGGAFALLDPQPTVTERGGGWYAVALIPAHTDTLGDLIVRATATGADPAERELWVGTTVADMAALTEAVADNTVALAANTAATETNTQTITAQVAATEANTVALNAVNATLGDLVAILDWIKEVSRGKHVRTQTHFEVYHRATNALLMSKALTRADGGTPKAMPATAAVIEEGDTVA